MVAINWMSALKVDQSNNLGFVGLNLKSGGRSKAKRPIPTCYSSPTNASRIFLTIFFCSACLYLSIPFCCFTFNVNWFTFLLRCRRFVKPISVLKSTCIKAHKSDLFNVVSHVIFTFHDLRIFHGGFLALR